MLLKTTHLQSLLNWHRIYNVLKIEVKLLITLSDIIFTIRKIHKLNQVDFASKTGVAQSSISKMESNAYADITFDFIAKISSEFGISTDDFKERDLRSLPFKDISSIIDPEFLVSGFIPHEIVALILSRLSDESMRKVKKKLGYHKEYKCIKKIKFNQFFLFKLSKTIGQEYYDVVDSLIEEGINILREFSSFEDKSQHKNRRQSTSRKQKA